jgi:hypothetical protein
MVNRQSFPVINRAAISTIAQCLFPASTDTATQSDMRALSRIVRTRALRQSRLEFSRVTHEEGSPPLIEPIGHKTPSSHSNAISKEEFDPVYQAGANSNLCFTARSSVLLKSSSADKSCLLGFLSCGEGRFVITSKQQHDWQKLCLKAVKEPDPQKQAAIVAELNRILQNRSKKAHDAPVNRVPRQRSA